MSISRRRFLGGIAAGAGTLTASAASAGTKKFSGHEGRFGLLHDTPLCVGCRSCEAACNTVNKLPAPDKQFDDKSVFASERKASDKAFTVVNRYAAASGDKPAVYRKVQCMHCNEPCCASVCFVEAFTKTPEGPVIYNPDVCVGCRYCMTACPYYATAYEYGSAFDPRVVKCTMCYPRIKEGKNPGCSDACPMGAITFGKREDLIKVARARMLKNPGRYIDHVYGEHEYGGTSWMILSGMPFAKLDLHEGATHTPLPAYTKGFLSVVPMVLTIWPGLLMGFYALSKRKERLSQAELEATVAETVANASEETQKKLAAAAKKATKAKDRAVQLAVKKALAEAKKEAEAAAKKEDSK